MLSGRMVNARMLKGSILNGSVSQGVFLAGACAVLCAGCAMFRGERSAGGILSLELPATTSKGAPSTETELSGSMMVGERLEVRLGASAGTGYVWTLAGPVPAIMQMTTADPAGVVSAVSGDRRVGGATMTTFAMTAVAQGEGRLKFVLQRPWEKIDMDAPPRTVDVTVEVRPKSSASGSDEPSK